MKKERRLISLGESIWHKLLGFFVVAVLFSLTSSLWKSSLFPRSGLQLFSDPEESLLSDWKHGEGKH